MDDSFFDEVYWKFCAGCGKPLQRQFTNSRYDKVTGKEYKVIIVFCGSKEHPNNHTWGTYEGESLEISEIPF